MQRQFLVYVTLYSALLIVYFLNDFSCASTSVLQLQFPSVHLPVSPPTQQSVEFYTQSHAGGGSRVKSAHIITHMHFSAIITPGGKMEQIPCELEPNSLTILSRLMSDLMCVRVCVCVSAVLTKERLTVHMVRQVMYVAGYPAAQLQTVLSGPKIQGKNSYWGVVINPDTSQATEIHRQIL